MSGVGVVVLWACTALFVLKILYNVAVGIRFFWAARNGWHTSESLAPIEVVLVPVIVVLSVAVRDGEWIAPWPVVLVSFIVLAVGTHLLWVPLGRLGAMCRPGPRHPDA